MKNITTDTQGAHNVAPNAEASDCQSDQPAISSDSTHPECYYKLDRRHRNYLYSMKEKREIYIGAFDESRAKLKIIKSIINELAKFKRGFGHNEEKYMHVSKIIKRLYDNELKTQNRNLEYFLEVESAINLFLFMIVFSDKNEKII